MNKKLALWSPITDGRLDRGEPWGPPSTVGYEWVNDLRWSSRAAKQQQRQWLRESSHHYRRVQHTQFMGPETSRRVASVQEEKRNMIKYGRLVVFRKNWSQYVVEVIDLGRLAGWWLAGRQNWSIYWWRTAMADDEAHSFSGCSGAVILPTYYLP